MLSRLPQALHFTHRVLALTVFGLVVLFALRARGVRRERPAAATLALLAAGLYAAQVLIGAANVWSRLAAVAVTAHVAVAGLLWGTVVAAAEASRLTVARKGSGSVSPAATSLGSLIQSPAGPSRT
jgi:heme A synthase